MTEILLIRLIVHIHVGYLTKQMVVPSKAAKHFVIKKVLQYPAVKNNTISCCVSI